MNCSGYEATDMLNGEGVRCSLWVSGCSHGCRGCFNQKAWSYSYGAAFTEADVERVLADLARPFIKGVTILGGEPLDPQNIDEVYKLILRIKEVYGEDKDVMVYTGYLFEDIPSHIKDVVDTIMDGKYDLNQPTEKPFRGSDNQRLWSKKNGIWQAD